MIDNAHFWETPILLSEQHWQAIQLGDLTLYLRRHGEEMLLAEHYQPAALPSLEPQFSPVTELPAAVKIKQRISDLQPICAVRLRPQLADRAYQVTAQTPLQLVPGSKALLYVRTPVWLQLYAVDDERLLAEQPVVTPMLSWIGPNTIEGKICYTTRSAAPNDLSEVSNSPHRVTTALELVNDGEKAIAVERLSLPVPQLAIFELASGALWSESVRIRFEAQQGHAAVVTGKTPPEQLGEAQPRAQAREKLQSGRLRTAIGMVLGA